MNTIQVQVTELASASCNQLVLTVINFNKQFSVKSYEHLNNIYSGLI